MMARARLRLLLSALLAVASTGAWCAGQDERIVNPKPDRTWASKVGGLLTSGKSIAVVIGISNYMGDRNGGYPPLSTAKDDADKMKRFLLEDAGFDIVYVLTDESATKEKIERVMTDQIPEVVGPNDRFLFYWSGHGVQRVRDDKSTFGFLPLAKSRIGEFSTMISMQDIQRWDGYLSARHALFVLDACLSGLAGVERKSARDTRLDQLSQPAHQLITAGTASENVISGDKWRGSLFTDSFIMGARKEAPQSFGIVSLHSLIAYIQERVAVEKEAARWSKSLTPQMRDLQMSTGAFFFTRAASIAPVAGAGSTVRINPGDTVTIGIEPKALLTSDEISRTTEEMIRQLMQGVLAGNPAAPPPAAPPAAPASSAPPASQPSPAAPHPALASPVLPAPQLSPAEPRSSISPETRAALDSLRAPFRVDRPATPTRQATLPPPSAPSAAAPKSTSQESSGPASAQLAGMPTQVALRLSGKDKVRLANFEQNRTDAIIKARNGAETPKDRATLASVLGGSELAIEPKDLMGEWRCRTLKLGGDFGALTIYDFFKCKIFTEGSLLILQKASGSQRTRGTLHRLTDTRYAYLGARTVNDDPPIAYGAKPEENEVAYLTRVDTRRLRLEFPKPNYESDFDILELVR